MIEIKAKLQQRIQLQQQKVDLRREHLKLFCRQQGAIRSDASKKTL